MTNSSLKKLVPILAFGLAGYVASAQTADSALLYKNAEKWVKSRVWAGNFKADVYNKVNPVVFEKQYEVNKATWDNVFTFLSDPKLADMAPGKYVIDANSLASISYAPSKKEGDTKWESHRKLIDLQYVISGKEKMGLVPMDKATVTEPYLESRDIAHYNADGKYDTATPKEFFIFFPQEVHRVGIKVDGVDSVKKVVVKIKYVQ